MSLTLLISFLPLVIGVLALSSTSGAIEAVVKVFFSGELYFYAMSLCASIYVTSQLSGHESNLNMRLWSGAFVLACSAFMAFYIGQNVTSEPESHNLHRYTSIVFLGLAVFINYRVLVLADQPPPLPEEVNRERADELVANVDPDYGD